MEKLDEYRQHIITALRRYADVKLPDGAEMAVICDKEQDHYQLMSLGWHGQQPWHGCILHLSVKSGKIWIHHDGTESGVAGDLEEMGVLKEDIVLAFHAPYKRHLTGYAAA